MGNSIESKHAVFKTASIFILIDAAIWLAFAGITMLGNHPSYGEIPLLRWGYSIAAVLIGGGLIALVILLNRRSHAAYTLSLAALVVLSLVNLFDQMGLVDFAVLAAAVIPLVLLLISRRWYFANKIEK